MIYTTTCHSPIGPLLLAERGGKLIGLWIEGQPVSLSASEPTVEMKTPALLQAEAWLDRYFAGKQPPISQLALAPEGSDFQQGVWEILCRIPYGQVMTYGQIASEMAARMGKQRMSAQAVGGAVGRNPISIIIPCHRVVGANKNLTGYAGGIDRKIALLTHEGIDPTTYHLPK